MTEQTRGCAAVSAPEPQKLLLAPLLGPPSGAPAAAPAAAAGAEAAGVCRAPPPPPSAAQAQASEPAARRGEPPDPADRGAGGGRRRWWQITEAEEEGEREDETGALGSRPGTPAEDAATDAAHPKAELLRQQLAAHARLAGALQVENATLSDALKRAREQWAVTVDEAAKLQKENAALRGELQKFKEQRQQLPAAEQKLQGICAWDSLPAEERPQATKPEVLTVANLEAELHMARVALVSIVPELERRLGERDAALKQAEGRVRDLEAQLEEGRRAGAWRGHLQRLLGLLRPLVPPEAEVVLREAEQLAMADPALCEAGALFAAPAAQPQCLLLERRRPAQAPSEAAPVLPEACPVVEENALSSSVCTTSQSATTTSRASPPAHVMQCVGAPAG